MNPIWWCPILSSLFIIISHFHFYEAYGLPTANIGRGTFRLWRMTEERLWITNLMGLAIVHVPELIGPTLLARSRSSSSTAPGVGLWYLQLTPRSRPFSFPTYHTDTHLPRVSTKTSLMTETPDSSLSSDALLRPDQNRGYFHPRAKTRETKTSPLGHRKILLLGSFLCIGGTAFYYFLSERSEAARWAHTIEVAPTKAPFNPSVLLNSNATTRFRGGFAQNLHLYLFIENTLLDNLSPSRKYVTTFNSSGFTNQVMTVVNLIYLAILTGRIPIIPQLLPEHFGTLDTVSPIAFGDVFDIPRLKSELGIPIVEWDEVKASKSPENEPIGCWSTRAGIKITENHPALTYHPDILNLSMFIHAILL